MNVVLRTFLVIGILVYFYILLYLIKKNRLNLKYTLLWIFSGLIMLVVVIFPTIMRSIIRLLGIASFTNGLLSLTIFFIIIILMSITGIVSKMKEDNKKLIQKSALLEKRVREIEKQLEYDKN